MRILSFGNCPMDPTLGSGKTRLARSEGLRAKGHQVETWDSPRLFQRWAGRLGVRLGLACSARRVIAGRNLRDYDLIEFFGIEFWWATRWVRQQRRHPLIVAHTDGLELLAYERLAGAARSASAPAASGKLERWLPFDYAHCATQAFSRAERFAALCQLDVDFVVRRGLFAAAHTQTIPPGLDPEYLGRAYVETRENVVAFFGSWTDSKGIEHLTPVLRRFLGANPAWRFSVIGAPSAAAAVHAAFGAELAGRVEVAPKLPVAEIARRLDRVKILIAPSEYEGFGLATAEAMGCGCAAIVTPTGFAGELQPGLEAMVCDFGDRHAMEHALGELARSDARREAVGRAGWARVQRLRWADAIELLEKTYQRWLDDNHGDSSALHGGRGPRRSKRGEAV